MKHHGIPHRHGNDRHNGRRSGTTPVGETSGESLRLDDFDLEFLGYDRNQVAHALHYLTARLAAVTRQLEVVAQLRNQLRQERQEVERLRQQVAHPPEWPGRLVELIQEAERLRQQAEQDAHPTRAKRDK